MKQSAYKFSTISTSNNIDILLEEVNRILKEGNSHNANLYNKEYWEWQYKHLPSSLSFVYLAYNYNNKLVGYYHVPLYLAKFNGKERTVAMVQDVAVSATERGKGLFRELSNYANDDLIKNGVDLAYTFPNKKSIHTFLKYNKYNQLLTFDTFVLPVDIDLLIKSKFNNVIIKSILNVGLNIHQFLFSPSSSVATIDELVINNNFSHELANYFNNFYLQFDFYVIRNYQYLHWRYDLKPSQSQKIISFVKDSKILASAIFKKDTILGVNALILMDFAFENENDLILLINAVKKNSSSIFKESIALIFTSFNCHKFLKKRLNGFIKIPQKFNPRPLNLLARNLNSNLELSNKSKWMCTLSDWDVL